MCMGVPTSVGAVRNPAAPEVRIMEVLQREAGVTINPQVIKLIVRYNWAELAKAAHEIHGS